MPKQTRETEIRFVDDFNDSELEGYLSELVDTGQASDDVFSSFKDIQESSVFLREMTKNINLETLLELRQNAVDELEKTNRWFCLFLPGASEKHRFWSKELDRLSLRIYELVNPPGERNEVDEILARAEESFQKGLKILDGKANS